MSADETIDASLTEQVIIRDFLLITVLLCSFSLIIACDLHMACLPQTYEVHEGCIGLYSTNKTNADQLTCHTRMY